MRILVFGTTYVDTAAKLQEIVRWRQLHTAMNPQCDLMLVDSASPMADCFDFMNHVLQLGNNIGHLARKGQDGWGRAFCAGLQHAVDEGYDFAVHIEGDSLLRRPVAPLCGFMKKQDLKSFVVGVNGTKFKEFSWVETGIMFLSVPYVRDSDFITRYDWRDGESKKYPNTPEAVVCRMLEQDGVINIAPIKTMRDDRGILTKENVGDYDWISHTTPEIYSTFITSTTVPA